jgi:lipoyl(octanoyl) transferase
MNHSGVGSTRSEATGSMISSTIELPMTMIDRRQRNRQQQMFLGTKPKTQPLLSLGKTCFVFTAVLAATIVLDPTSSCCEAWLLPLPSSSSFNVGTIVPGRSGNKRTCGIPKQQKLHSWSLAMISKQQLGTFEILEESQLDVPDQCDRKVVLLDYTAAKNEEEEDDDDGMVSSSTGSNLIDFETAWDFQKDLMERHFTRLATQQQQQQQQSQSQSHQDATIITDPRLLTSFMSSEEEQESHATNGRDTVIMLQHHPVYTLGTGSDEKFVLVHNADAAAGNNDDRSTVPVVRMDRGGEVTYHGPGQLTVYPVLDLRSYRQDIHWYMRALEEATILALSECGIDPTTIERQDDVTGVWVQNHKVAAVGIKCRKWITMHGVAINVEDRALDNFDGIVPCGLEGRQVGCVNQFLRSNGLPELTVHEFSIIMTAALEEVFRIRLVRQKQVK